MKGDAFARLPVVTSKPHAAHQGCRRIIAEHGKRTVNENFTLGMKIHCAPQQKILDGWTKEDYVAPHKRNWLAVLAISSVS